MKNKKHGILQKGMTHPWRVKVPTHGNGWLFGYRTERGAEWMYGPGQLLPSGVFSVREHPASLHRVGRYLEDEYALANMVEYVRRDRGAYLEHKISTGLAEAVELNAKRAGQEERKRRLISTVEEPEYREESATRKCSRKRCKRPAAKDRKMCAKCLDNAKRARERKKAKGLCAGCGKAKPAPGNRSCANCLDYYRRKGAEREQQLREQGLCVKCGKNPISAGRGSNYCDPCYQMHYANRINSESLRELDTRG